MKTDPQQWRPFLGVAGLTLIPLHSFSEFVIPEKVDGEIVHLGKMPRVPGWTTAEFDSRTVAREAAREGNNVGVRLSDSWLVVDYDKRRDPCDSDWFNFLWLFDVELKAFPVVQTGGGGFHIYMRKPAALALLEAFPADTEPHPLPSIEFKSSTRRQVVAPGSVHPSGRLYSWQPGGQVLREAPEAPAPLLKALTRPPRPKIIKSTTEFGFTVEDLEHMLSGLDPRDHSDRRQWFTIGAACHNASEGVHEARDVWAAWCAQDPRYDNGESNTECVKLWASLDKTPDDVKRAGMGTLIYLLREAGREDLIPNTRLLKHEQRVAAEWAKIEQAKKDFEDD